MKCVCIQKCQHRDSDKKAIMYMPGDVADFKKVPAYFVKLETRKINFITASEAELKKAKWAFEDAAKAIKAEFDVELANEEGTKKSDIVKQILDARYRQVD